MVPTTLTVDQYLHTEGSNLQIGPTKDFKCILPSGATSCELLQKGGSTSLRNGRSDVGQKTLNMSESAGVLYMICIIYTVYATIIYTITWCIIPACDPNQAPLAPVAEAPSGSGFIAPWSKRLSERKKVHDTCLYMFTLW